jgi:hypothetical protein
MVRAVAFSGALLIITWILLKILPSSPSNLRSTLFAGWILGAAGVLTLPYLILGILNAIRWSEPAIDPVRRAVAVTAIGGLIAFVVIKAVAMSADLDEFVTSLIVIAHFGLQFLLRKRIRRAAGLNSLATPAS